MANLSFSSRSFPSNLKIPNAISIFKKDNRTIYNKYRLISLLSNISKIIDKLLNTRLTMSLKKHNVLCQIQFDFRHNNSKSQ